jgi:hypothetical protein
MRTGCRMIAASAFFSMVTALAGVSAAPLRWALLVLFACGAVDVAVAALFNMAARERGEFCLAVEFDEAGIRVWTGRDALERRRERRDLLAMADLRAPEKRLLPLSPAWRDAGVEFPEPPAYSRHDRHGRPQPPFPVHFRNLPSPMILEDGARMPPLVAETHSDPDHEGCPVCEAWKHARRTYRTWEMSW